MNLPSKVMLREVSTRDGFQSVQQFIPTEKKLEIIEAIARAGVKEIETTSFVSPKVIPNLRDAAELISKVPRAGIKHAALVPNSKGAQNAINAGIDQVVVVISATEAHNHENLRRNIGESLADLDGIFRLAQDKTVPVTGAIAVSFGCPYQGDVPEKDVFKLVKAYISKGATRVILADTTGMATPTRVERMVDQFRSLFPHTEFALHFHNNRGTAMANLLSGLMAGATIFDTALGGIGGCPYVPRAAGNLPTEDVVFMLEDMGMSTGIDLIAIIRASHLLEKILGYTLPGQVMKSGPRNPRLAAKVCGTNRSNQEVGKGGGE